MSTVYRFSWNEDGFLTKLNLVFRSYWRVLKAFSPKEKTEALSALSSTLYSVAGTAWVTFSSRNPTTWFWLPLGGWCYLHMGRVSDRMKRISTRRHTPLSIRDLDIRQSILCKKSRLEEARTVIRLALDWCESGLFTHTDTYALLNSSLIQVTLDLEGVEKKGEWAFRRAYWVATNLAEPLTERDPAQASRVYRALAEVALRTGHPMAAQVYWHSAHKLAERHNLKDQLVKLVPLEERIRTTR